jgi:hypothetical protein
MFDVSHVLFERRERNMNVFGINIAMFGVANGTNATDFLG